MKLHFFLGDCRVGRLLVAEKEERIEAVFMGDNDETLITAVHHVFPSEPVKEGGGCSKLFWESVYGLIERPDQACEVACNLIGTPFQKRVWRALRGIPCGSTMSYSDLAMLIGAPRAVRAVANACAMNRLAVIFPCHRVIRKDGQLGGYRWSIARKKALLAWEIHRLGNRYSAVA